MLTAIASSVVLKKNANTACTSISRRMTVDAIATSEVYPVAPTVNEKYMKSA